MENNLFVCLLILFIGLYISFIIFITDYSIFKKRIERILDLNIKIGNDIKEVINLDSEINKGVKDVCDSNKILISNIDSLLHHKIDALLRQNSYLKTILENKENNEK